MKNNSRGFWLATLATVSMVGLFACGGDDDDAKAEPRNQLKLGSETIYFAEADVDSVLNISDELGEYSYHEFYLTSDGLSMSETGDLSGSGDLVIFGLISDSPTKLEEGTYELGLNAELGDVDYFTVYSNLTETSIDAFYTAYRGTIKVSKSDEDHYTLAFDFDIFTSQTEDESEEFVDGKIQGNYKGTVDVIIGGGAKLPSARAAKGKKTFTWL